MPMLAQSTPQIGHWFSLDISWLGSEFLNSLPCHHVCFGVIEQLFFQFEIPLLALPTVWILERT